MLRKANKVSLDLFYKGAELRATKSCSLSRNKKNCCSLKNFFAKSKKVLLLSMVEIRATCNATNATMLRVIPHLKARLHLVLGNTGVIFCRSLLTTRRNPWERGLLELESKFNSFSDWLTSGGRPIRMKCS